MPLNLTLKEFIQKPGVILDVRSPLEYQQGHIPGSCSFPLFSNEERAQIGTTYKTKSRQQAVEQGLIIVQSKLELIMNQAFSLLTSDGKVLCWRGGMRSGFVARFLELLGFSIITLQGGYKSFRRWVLEYLSDRSPSFSTSSLRVIGGLTGSGKTDILQHLQQIGEQVIDIEELTQHRGSAFGAIGKSPQPTQEQFENKLAVIANGLDWSKPIWIEDESRMVGRCRLPTVLYQSMFQAPLFYVERPQSFRLQHLLAQYGQASNEQLFQATERIRKRLGSELTKEVFNFIEQGNREKAFESLLTYYDKAYQHQLGQRRLIYMSNANNFSSYEWACALQNYR